MHSEKQIDFQKNDSVECEEKYFNTLLYTGHRVAQAI